MHIHMETQNLPLEFHWNPSCPIRGTEEFYVNTSYHLALSGHHVTVAYDGPYVSVGNVVFVPRGIIKKADILLDCNIRTPHHHRGFDAARYVAWTNFVDAKADQYSSYDALICISNTHHKMLGGGIVIPHGIDHDKYIPLQKTNVVIYTSSMDRGGLLLRDNREYIERSTGGSLIFSRYPTGGNRECIYPPLSEEEMARLYGQAKWWIHPGMGVELFCIAAAKAQSCGCIPIVRPTMALDETVQCGYKIRTDDENTFIQAVVDAMNGVSNSSTTYLGMPANPAAHIPTWQEATAQLAAVLTDGSQNAD